MPVAGILTFLHNDNVGSLLQAFALQRTVASLGWQARLIDYAPSRTEKVRNLLTSGNSPKLILEGLRKRSSPAAGERHEALARFREKLERTPVCRDGAGLRSAAASCDALICGSDQIWSPVWLNPAYFLNFALPGQPRIAYAPSLGVQRLPDSRKAQKMTALLRGFQAVSVREEEGAVLMEALTGTRPPVMPDPVFLLSPEEWRAMAAPPEAPGCALCYFIGENPAYWPEAEACARELGKPLRVLPVTAESMAQPHERNADCSPESWLGAIAGASLLVTDSFHGAAFAALLGTPCRILRRWRDGDPESKNSRIDQLARMLGQEPAAQAERLTEVRERGREWLREALSAAAPARTEAGK